MFSNNKKLFHNTQPNTCRHRYTTRRERCPLPAASACQKERVVSTSREAHGGHVVVDHSPQAGSGEWWTGGASQKSI